MSAPISKVARETQAQIEAILAAIAAKHLGIPTLEARGAKDLDSHQVGVRELRAALRKALMLGTEIGVGLTYEHAKKQV